MCNCNCGRKARRDRGLILIVAVALALVLLTAFTGCLSTADMAPPPRERLDATRYNEEDFAAFDAGRDIYLRQCGTCHSIEPIDRYSRQAWLRILPGMAKEAKLDEGQTGLLTDYILTIHNAMVVSE